MDNTQSIGKTVSHTGIRDAVHVAMISVSAAVPLKAGDRVTLTTQQEATRASHHYIGIVDPFLRDAIAKGDKFWLWLKPGSITSLTHLWTHPDIPFPANESKQANVQQLMSQLAEVADNIGGFTADQALNYYVELADGGDPCWPDDLNKYDPPELFWILGEAITGKTVPASIRGEHYFRCAC